MPSLPTPPLRSDLWPPTSAHSLRLSAQGARNKKFRLCLLRLPLVVCGRRFGRGLAWMGKQKMLPSIKYLLKVWRSAWIGARPKGDENIMLAFHYVFHRWLNNFDGSLIEALFVSSILAEPSIKKYAFVIWSHKPPRSHLIYIICLIYMAQEIAKQQPFHRSCLGPKKKAKCWTKIGIKKRDPRTVNKICFICMPLARTWTWLSFCLLKRGLGLINGQSEFE